MALRDLVTGGAACAVPGATSSSNPLGALANALVGSSSSKPLERLNEIPTTPGIGTSGSVYPEFERQVGLPGSEHEQQQLLPPNAQEPNMLIGDWIQVVFRWSVFAIASRRGRCCRWNCESGRIDLGIRDLIPDLVAGGLIVGIGNFKPEARRFHRCHSAVDM